MLRDRSVSDPNPLVSVIVPTYNRSQYVCEAVHSVLGQTFGNLEVVVVDDRSTDDTASRLATIQDPRLTVIVDGHWGWPAKVRNVGIRSARGRFLGFLDSDDLWLPRKLERQLDALEATGLGWAHAGVRTIGDDGEPHPTLGTYRPRANGWIVRDLILRRAAINCSTVLVRRELLDRAGTFDETFVSGEDTELMVSIGSSEPRVRG